MKTFTIDGNNQILVFASKKEAAAASITDIFANQNEFAELTAEWPMQRLVGIWNAIPGVNPISKFTSRKIAIERLWKAIQNLDVSDKPEPAVQPQGAAAQPTETTAVEPEVVVEQPETQAPAQTVEPVSDAGAQVADVDFPLADAGTLGECAVVPLEHAAERGGHLGHFAGVRAVLEAVRNVVPGYGGLFSKVVVPKDVPENGEFSGRPTFPLVSSNFLVACAPHTWSGSLVRCASDGERYNDWLTQIGG